MVRVAGAAVLLLAAGGLLAQPDGGPVAGTATSAAATFSARAPGSDQFRVVPENAELRAGDLLVALPGATARGANGAVTVASPADYDGTSPLPILDTAFTLNEPKDADLDVTLDRGRLDLTNTKPAGAATAKVRFWEQAWTVTLDAPGTRVAFELCARWPAGTRFKAAEPGGTPKGGPVASLVCLALKGDPTVNVGGTTFGLAAPPGPALVEWDSVDGPRRPQRLEKLPPWADPNAALSAGGKKAAAAVEKFRAARAADAAAAARTFLGSSDPAEQRVALVMAGATDDLDLLVKELGEAKTPEEWDFGTTVLRHWLGRGPGQDQKLYARLTARGLTPAQARIVMQLLLGFSPEDFRQPETYEVLIDYLTDDLPAIRNLAAWHLVRAVPGGRSVGFKPGGSKAECETAAREWRRRVPPGQLPVEVKK